VDTVDMAADLVDHLADVSRSHEHHRRCLQHLSPPALQFRAAAHRVLELGAVRLHGVSRSRRSPDRAAEQDVVAENEIGRQVLAHGRRVRSDPRVELLASAVLQQLHAVALVVIEDEDREQSTDVGPHDLRPADVVAFRMRLLTEDGDVMARARPRARELACVDVRPRSAQQVPMPDNNSHAK
jgi:hypothetical protein